MKINEEKVFNLTQQLRKFGIEELDFRVGFAQFSCGCDSGVTVFYDMKPLFNISFEDKRTIDELCKELTRHRNKLNRNITTLKKASLKQ